LNFLIDLVIVDRAAAAHDTEDRDHVAQAEGCHLPGAGEKTGIAEDRDRAHAAEKGARTDSDCFGFTADTHMADLVAPLHPSDQVPSRPPAQTLPQSASAETSCLPSPRA